MRQAKGAKYLYKSKEEKKMDEICLAWECGIVLEYLAGSHSKNVLKQTLQACILGNYIGWI